MGFLTFVLPIPHGVAVWLMWVSFLLASISAYGAFVAHYREHHRSPDAPSGTTTLATPVPALPDIPTVDARVCWIIERDGGYAEWDITMTRGSFDTAKRAVVVAFRNDSPTPVSKVRAELSYVHSVTMDVERAACGSWLGERLDRASFGASETRELIVAVYDEGVMFAIQDNRRDPNVVSGCTARPLPFAHFTAYIMLSVLNSNEQLFGKVEERVAVSISNDAPTVEIIGPPGAIRGHERRTLADIDLVCDEWSASVEVTNNGESALFCAMLMVSGPVKSVRTKDIYCQWAHTTSVEARIAKGQKCRLIVADRRLEGGMNAIQGFSSWAIHALVDGHPFEIESIFHSTPFSVPRTVADDITVNVDIIANPDLMNGVERRCFTLTAFKALAAVSQS
jgi:hypothetical protein